MIGGRAVSGPLLSESFLQSLRGNVDVSVVRRLTLIVRQGAAHGPAISARALLDVLALPLAEALGFEVRQVRSLGQSVVTAALTCNERSVTMLAVTCGPIAGSDRLLLREAAGRGLRWMLHLQDRRLRLVDCDRPHSRRWLAFDLDRCAQDPRLLDCLRTLVSCEAFEPDEHGLIRLETMVANSDASLMRARAALQQGVETAAVTLTGALSARHHRPRLDRLFEESLTVVYRILFLMFAESRGLVPVWHPTYRESYTIESLRDAIEAGRDPRGTWAALQAIAGLAHRGARAGDLLVTPFNGRLFSPSHSPSVARSYIPDDTAAGVVAALTLAEAGVAPGSRIPFSDLGVEQLGAVYERVLDFTPSLESSTRPTVVLRRGSQRKSTGSFYTPRSLTDFLVRRTLHPLVKDMSSETILSLRVLDPAMGSGAFLVSACRFLARAYEAALAREGHAGAEDFSATDRAGFRRLVAQRCLYGVDLNPMAVQLGRLSIWLCALAADKPLSFLDHRLRTGNSLVGASLEDVAARAPGRRQVEAEPTLFDEDALEAIGRAVTVREELAVRPDETLADVHDKERLLARLESPEDPSALWRRLLDLWCAIWFWPEGETAPEPREFRALVSALRGDGTFLHRSAHARLATARQVASERHFFHWPLEFPEVFYEPDGRRRPAGGFDAVLGNPPWEMLREDTGAQASARRHRGQVVRFTRDSGIYRLQSAGHANVYQVFLERALQVLRPEGRLGMVLPWDCASGDGSARLRRFLFDRCRIDEIQAVDNREGIFPIHRGLRFVLLHATGGGRTETLQCRFGICETATLDRLPDDPTDSLASQAPARTVLSRSLLERLSGPGLAIPYLGSAQDVRILDALLASAGRADDPDGWGLRFGRELNATEDRALFSESRGGLPTEKGDSPPFSQKWDKGGLSPFSRGLPVIGGRHLAPFRVDLAHVTTYIDPAAAQARLGPRVSRARLAYRDVAGPGNRMTLIAAVVPAGVVTTHTLFCLRNSLARDDQLLLCALFNSYVLNFLVRQRVGTHVTTALVGSLPIPRPSRESARFRAIVAMAKQLVERPADAQLLAALQGRVAALYQLDSQMFERILETFPLVPAAERQWAHAAFREAAVSPGALS